MICKYEPCVEFVMSLLNILPFFTYSSFLSHSTTSLFWNDHTVLDFFFFKKKIHETCIKTLEKYSELNCSYKKNYTATYVSCDTIFETVSDLCNGCDAL